MIKQQHPYKCTGEQLLMHKSTGFGDTVEKFARKTGIKTIVDHVSQGLNIPCGCEQRKNVLNKMFPYKE